MEFNKKEFGKAGVTKETNDALEIFIDCVDLKLFSKNLRKVFMFYILGQIQDGWVLDDSDIPIIKDMILLFELIDTFEEEYGPEIELPSSHETK